MTDWNKADQGRLRRPKSDGVKLDQSDKNAFINLSLGKATPEQQKHVLDCIIYGMSRYYEISYCPSERDTAFAEGLRFVGQQVIAATTINHNIGKDT